MNLRLAKLTLIVTQGLVPCALSALTLLLLALSLPVASVAAPHPAGASLYVVNEGDIDLYVATVEKTWLGVIWGEGYHTRGWYKISPGSTKYVTGNDGTSVVFGLYTADRKTFGVVEYEFEGQRYMRSVRESACVSRESMDKKGSGDGSGPCADGFKDAPVSGTLIVQCNSLFGCGGSSAELTLRVSPSLADTKKFAVAFRDEEKIATSQQKVEDDYGFGYLNVKNNCASPVSLTISYNKGILTDEYVTNTWKIAANSYVSLTTQPNNRVFMMRATVYFYGKAESLNQGWSGSYLRDNLPMMKQKLNRGSQGYDLVLHCAASVNPWTFTPGSGAQSAAPQLKKAFVIIDGSNLYSFQVSNQVLLSLKIGEKVELLATNYFGKGWYKVRHLATKKEGWIHGNNIKPE